MFPGLRSELGVTAMSRNFKSQHPADFGRVGLAAFYRLTGAGEERDEAGADSRGEEGLAVAAGEDSSGDVTFQRRQEFGENEASGVAGARTGFAFAGDAPRGNRQAEL